MNNSNKKKCIYISTKLIQSSLVDTATLELVASKAKCGSGARAVLSITFRLQLASLQTGHPFYAVTNFCQYQWREEEVEKRRNSQ